MTISTEVVPVPAWDLADRLRKSLRVSGVGVQEMADFLEVSRNTVSAWVNGRTPPSSQSIRLWAARTGVPYDWLKYGYESPPPSPGHPMRRREDRLLHSVSPDEVATDQDALAYVLLADDSLLPRLDSNQEPSDCRFSTRLALCG